MVPATGPAALVSVKAVPATTVEQFNAAPALSGSCAGSCRNVALTVWLNAIPVAAVAGVVEATEGAATASKFHVFACTMALPARSFTPVVITAV